VVRMMRSCENTLREKNMKTPKQMHFNINYFLVAEM
jgi:hypothetical protein